MSQANSRYICKLGNRYSRDGAAVSMFCMTERMSLTALSSFEMSLIVSKTMNAVT